jgi:hypothetical protein
MPPNDTQRLLDLGVPASFIPDMAARRPPRFHSVLHFMIVAASLAAAVVAFVAWSWHVDRSAIEAAKSAQALLYDSDVGAETLGLIFTTLLASGWLCGFLTWQRGNESARDGWAADLMQVPAKYKIVIDWLWRRLIRRHTAGAASSQQFLDRLGRGVVRDLRLATLTMLALTAVLGALAPARVSYATATTIVDHLLLPLAVDAVHPLASAVAVISGCPNLPKDGYVLIYRLRFADKKEVDIGAWTPVTGSRVAVLEAIAASLPAGIARERFSNPIGSNPIAVDCLKDVGPENDASSVARLLRLLTVTGAEMKEFFPGGPEHGW